jgi:hypothetical protein
MVGAAWGLVSLLCLTLQHAAFSATGAPGKPFPKLALTASTLYLSACLPVCLCRCRCGGWRQHQLAGCAAPHPSKGRAGRRAGSWRRRRRCGGHRGAAGVAGGAHPFPPQRRRPVALWGPSAAGGRPGGPGPAAARAQREPGGRAGPRGRCRGRGRQNHYRHCPPHPGHPGCTGQSCGCLPARWRGSSSGGCSTGGGTGGGAAAGGGGRGVAATHRLSGICR